MIKVSPYLIPAIHRYGRDAEMDGKMIINAVMSYYGFSYDEVVGKDRRAELVRARHIVMYFMKDYKHRYRECGMVVNRDHSMAIYACKKVRDLMSLYEDYNKDVFNIGKIIKENWI